MGQVAGDVLPTDRVRGNLPAHVGAKAGVGPGQPGGHDLLGNGLLILEQAQDLVPEERFENVRVRGGLHREEGPVPRKEAPGDQPVDMGMPVQEVPVTLDADHRPRDGSPGVGCDLK